ncbi:hypothetical protein AltI4_15260 [Alteromonas sp. I4]|nr:hypothetical protein AltI4_15260 [Alteromonas sp. I4]
MLAAAVVGGTASAVTGGKFANGAITAAFMKGYNDANHPSFKHPDAKLGKFFQSIRDGAAQIRGSIERGISSIGESLNSITDSLTSTGVLVVGVESTSVFTVAGQKKGGGGIYVDFDNRQAGTYVKSGVQLTGNGDDLAGGMELQAAISVDVVKSVEHFRGTSIESGGSIGPIGLDYSIVEGQGFVSGGFDIGAGGGGSVMKMETETISHWKF